MKRFTLLLLTVLSALSARSQSVPTTLNYQGRLTDNTPAQTPVSATVPMKFEIFDALTAGTSKWTETPGSGILVVNGIFNVALGSTTPIAPTVFTGANSTRYLEVTLNPGASQEILTPRQLISAGGYANLAQNANTAVSANNAATVTNGVYTTGSYANPPWITSLALTGAISASNLSGTNSGNVTLTPVGAAPNANGASLAGQALTLQPANGTNPGILTTGAQTIGGDKTFTGNISAANLTPPLGVVTGMTQINPNNLTPFWLALYGGSLGTLVNTIGTPMAVACTFTSLTLRLDAGTPTGANTITVTLYKNGTATTMTVSLAAPLTTGATVIASDTIHPFPVVAGDAVAIGFTQTNSVPVARFGVSTRCQ